MKSSHFALEQMTLARRYTCDLLETIDPQRWFEMPAGCPSHIAWQVGHLAMAQFRLGIYFVREVTPADAAILPMGFIDHFRRGTRASARRGDGPSVEVIREAFTRMHEHLLANWFAYDAIDLDAPPLHPHRVSTTRLGSLTWMARHEMIHAGQIGLIRRMLGAPAIW